MRIVLELLEKLGEEKTQEEDDVDGHKAAAEAVRKAVVDMETAAQRYDALRAEMELVRLFGRISTTLRRRIQHIFEGEELLEASVPVYINMK